MSKYFYSHIVEIDSIVMELDKLKLSESEKKHLLELADSSLYHLILDLILSELSEDDKKTFLKHLSSENHDKIWEHLNSKIKNIEEKIKKTADELTEKLHKDIQETKTK